MLGVLLPALTAGPAQAATQAEVQAQIDNLGNQISTLDEQYNAATLHLQQVQGQIRDSESASAQAQANRSALQKVASKQAAAIYTEGAPDLMITFLTAKSLDDFNKKMQLFSQVNNFESGVVTRLQIADQKAKVATDTLNHELAQAQTISRTIADRRASLVAQVAKQQTLLAQINAATRAAELAAAVAKAEAVKAALAQAAARAQAAASAAANNRVAPAVSAALGAVGTAVANLPLPISNKPSSGLPSSGRAGIALQTAMAQIGKPYQWAGSGPNVFDCSGLTMFAWAAAGLFLPHSAAAQYAMFPHVARNALQPGDLVFFGSPIHHDGMYVGGGQMVNAPHTGADVRIQPIDRSDYVGASRPS